MKKFKLQLEIIGWYQLIGGSIGILMVLFVLFQVDHYSGYNILVLFLMISFYGYSIICGLSYIRYKDYSIPISLINQYLQIIGFAVLGYSYFYVSGASLTLGLDLSGSVDLKLGGWISDFKLNFSGTGEGEEVKINLAALGLIYWLDKIAKGIKSENAKISLVTETR